MSGAGVALGSSDYRIEANAYLQRRLVIIYGFVLGASLLFLALDFLSSWLSSGDQHQYPEHAGRLIHVVGTVALVVHYVFLRRRRYSEVALRYFDAFVVLGTIATGLGIYINGMGTGASTGSSGSRACWWWGAASPFRVRCAERFCSRFSRRSPC